MAYWQFDTEAVRFAYAEAVSIAESIGDPKLLADALYDFSFTIDRRDPERYLSEATEALERALDLFRGIGDEAGVARVRWSQANLPYLTGDFESMRELSVEALEGARALGDDFLAGWATFTLSTSLAHLGRVEEGRRSLLEALAMFREAGDLTGVLFSLDALADTAIRSGEWERGVRLSAASSSLKRDTGAELVETEREIFGAPEHGLSDQEAARARAEGEAMTVDQAVEYALARPTRSPDSVTTALRRRGRDAAGRCSPLDSRRLAGEADDHPGEERQDGEHDDDDRRVLHRREAGPAASVRVDRRGLTCIRVVRHRTPPFRFSGASAPVFPGQGGPKLRRSSGATNRDG
jgi:hypothetical protein